MFKKLILSTALITSFAFAGQTFNKSNEIKKQVEEAFKTQLEKYKGVSFKILNITKDKNLGDNIYIGTNIINFNGKQNVGMFIAFNTKQNSVVILPVTSNTVLFNKKGIFVDSALIKEASLSVKKQNELKKQEQQKLTDNFLKYFNKTDNPIILSKGHEKSLVIVTDPNCPYCVQKMKNKKGLKKLAEKYNIIVILAPIVEYDKNGNIIKNRSLHPNSPYYSASLLTHLKDKQTFEDKMKVINKYFQTVSRNDKNIAKLKYDKKYLETVKNNNQKYYNKIGIQGTPTFIILDKNETKQFFNKLK